jgi:hypothetical protein
MELWLRADAGLLGGTQVTGWLDQSGNDNDAVQLDSASQPQLVSGDLNGQPAVRFDGNADSLSLPNFMAGQAAGEIFVVLKAANTGLSTGNSKPYSLGGAQGPYNGTDYTAQDSLLYDDFGSSATFEIGQPKLGLDGWRVYNVSSSGTGWAARQDGIVLYSTPDNTVSFPTGASLALGQGADGSPWAGDIAEVIVYNRALSNSERATVEGYLANKYGLVAPAPQTPSGLAGTILSGTQASLTWQASGSGQTTYVIERRTGNGDYNVVGLVTGATTFVDSGLDPGSTYFYRISAVDSGGASGDSAEISLTTPANADSTANDPGLTIYGRNPNAGVVPDSNGQVGLEVYTPSEP